VYVTRPPSQGKKANMRKEAVKGGSSRKQWGCLGKKGKKAGKPERKSSRM